MANDPRFLSPMGSRLRELGLDVKDVNVGRYIQIDLSEPRPEPEEFAEFGEFDTFVVLNPHELPADAKVWLYFNNKRPESRMPLHRLSRLETVADRFYLQHADSWEGVTLEVLIGGDLRALNVDPRDKGTVTLERAYIDVTDRPNRKLGNVDAEVTGEVDITDRPTRELGSVSVPGVATEPTLEAVRSLLESLEDKDFATENTLATLVGKDFATQTTLAAILDKLDNLEVTLKGSVALGDEQITIEEDDVMSLSPPQGATVAYITVNEGAVRYRIGADPTGTLGHRANGDDDIVLASAEDIAAFRVTNDDGQSYSTIFVTYSGAIT
jgi:hypothetical protein